MGLIRKALDFLKADPPQAADITTPAEPVPEPVTREKVFCTNCEHRREDDRYYRFSSMPILTPVCAANVERPERTVVDYVTGVTNVFPPTFHTCWTFNHNGECSQFSPLPQDPAD